MSEHRKVLVISKGAMMAIVEASWRCLWLLISLAEIGELEIDIRMGSAETPESGLRFHIKQRTLERRASHNLSVG